VKGPPLKTAGNADRYNYRDSNDDYRQAGDCLISAAQKERLFDYIKAAMDGAPTEIVKCRVLLFYRAGPGYGVGFAISMRLAAGELPTARAAE
jgi:catalase